MSVNVYDISIPPIIRSLRNLHHIIQKGESWAKDNNRDPQSLLTAQLAPDMKPLLFQVQRLSDTAKGIAHRVGTDVPALAIPDDEATFADAYARIAKTIEYLEAAPRSAFEGVETKEVVLPFAPDLKMTGVTYVTDYALPNFYFHVTTAYLLLRNQGVPLGKWDYLTGAAGPQ